MSGLFGGCGKKKAPQSRGAVSFILLLRVDPYPFYRILRDEPSPAYLDSSLYFPLPTSERDVVKVDAEQVGSLLSG